MFLNTSRGARCCFQPRLPQNIPALVETPRHSEHGTAKPIRTAAAAAQEHPSTKRWVVTLPASTIWNRQRSARSRSRCGQIPWRPGERIPLGSPGMALQAWLIFFRWPSRTGASPQSAARIPNGPAPSRPPFAAALRPGRCLRRRKTYENLRNLCYERHRVAHAGDAAQCFVEPQFASELDGLFQVFFARDGEENRRVGFRAALQPAPMRVTIP